MFKIESLQKSKYEEFRNMFLDYFIIDYGVKYDSDKLRESLVNKTIIKQFEAGIILIDIIKENNNTLGFIIYQIDKENSDWKERLGSGFIREFYIKKEFRQKGLGSMLLNNAELNLKKLGAKEVYLTSSEKVYVKKFYESNGYKPCQKRAKNGEEYFEKNL